jgi:hypothetical protein
MAGWIMMGPGRDSKEGFAAAARFGDSSIRTSKHVETIPGTGEGQDKGE